MAKRRRRLMGPAAVSALAIASMVGPATATADVVCVDCPPPTTFGNPGLNNAFAKMTELGFPGNTSSAFQKVGGMNAFFKLSSLGFPGNTGDVFAKFSSP